MIVGMNHFTVISEDEKKTLDFYVGLLGLQIGHRPDLGFPGAWLYAGGSQAVLKEQLLRITLEVEIVKLLPKT